MSPSGLARSTTSSPSSEPMDEDSSVSISPPSSPVAPERLKNHLKHHGPDENSYAAHHDDGFQEEENNPFVDGKICPPSTSAGKNVMAEFYYKQLLAANVAAFGKAAAASKMAFGNSNAPNSVGPGAGLCCSPTASSMIHNRILMADEKHHGKDGSQQSAQDDDTSSTTGGSISSNEDSNGQLDTESTSANNQKSAFVWSPTSDQAHHGHHGHPSSSSGVVPSVGNNKCLGNGQLPSNGSHHNGAPQPQGLVHWMSVMAEHMNNANNTSHHHHEPPPMHYMWNGVDCSGSHIKDNEYSWSRQAIMKQGYEGKISHNSEQHNQKGAGIDDNPLSAGSVATASPLYNGNGSQNQAPRSLSSNSSCNSPTPVSNASSHMLVVPHPINATKITDAHHVVTQNTSGRKYQCKMCPSIFTSKSELQLHSQLHMREVKPYKCTQCSKTFANSSYLSQHTRIHLGIKPYRCEICQRKFTQLSHLQQHIRTHTGDKPYKCRHLGCTKAFSQLSNLQSHSRCHQTDKPYKCNSCYKCFSDEPSLLEHIPKHKESKHLKTHICQYCGKSYTQETYLTKHMQKHAERLEKRPPLIGIPRVTLDNSHYWPKVSPDTANTLVDAINQQEAAAAAAAAAAQAACLHGSGNGGGSGANSSVISPDHHLQQQREMNGSAGGAEDHILRISSSSSSHPSIPSSHASLPSSSTPPGSSPIHPYEPIITVSTPGGGGGGGKTPPSSSSAFTPIQSSSMGGGIHGGHHNHGHHNHHLNHHQLSERPPYLSYNALAFPGSKMVPPSGQLSGLSGGVPNSMDPMVGKAVNSMPTNAFPNQLISLHQIRNYAHQPHSLMPADHFMQGLKDKSQ